MILEKMKLTNFKRFFGSRDVYFNDDFNVIIGDNESGKSSILLALDFVLSGSQNKIEAYGLENIFNHECITTFMNGNRQIEDLPEIVVELYIKDVELPELEGNNNQERTTANGIKMEIKPDEDYYRIINESLTQDNAVFPFEYYKISFKKFSDEPYNSYKRPIKHILIDSSNISSEYHMKEYISSLYSAHTDDTKKNYYNLEFRKSKSDFENKVLCSLNANTSNIKFGLTNNNKYSLENNLAIYENGIDLWNKGSGMQCVLKIKSSVDKKAEKIDLILIEEPENHLSDMNMKQLIQDIIDTNKKQTFITTHNSMICSRLNLKKIIALSENEISATKFSSIPSETADFFVKCPSNSLLNFILSSKVLLVEGAAEYILLEEFYSMQTGSSLNTDKVNVISTNGLSSKRYLEVAKELGTRVGVITDNDHDYESNINHKFEEFNSINSIHVFSDHDNERNTFEVCIFKDNVDYINNSNITESKDKQKFMLNNKAEFAYRLLKILKEDSRNFKIPQYILDAIEWIRS